MAKVKSVESIKKDKIVVLHRVYHLGVALAIKAGFDGVRLESG
ncbi:hypothetical protein [Colwellia piezophila]|nr:hypothetical protein [Colwellia piezophila]